MAHALAERSCELQLLRQHLLGKEPLRTQSAGTSLLKQDKQPLQVRVVCCVLLCFFFFLPVARESSLLWEELGERSATEW